MLFAVTYLLSLSFYDNGVPRRRNLKFNYLAHVLFFAIFLFYLSELNLNTYGSFD